MGKENDKLNIFLHVDYEYPCKYSTLTLHRPSRVFEDPFDEGDSIAEDYIMVNNEAYIRLLRSEYRKLLMGRFADDCSVDAYATYREALERHFEESRKKEESEKELKRDAAEAIKILESSNPPGENVFAENPIKDQASDEDFEFDEDAPSQPLSPVAVAKPDTDSIMKEVKEFILDQVKARKLHNIDLKELRETVARHIEEDNVAKVIRDALLENRNECADTFARAARILNLVKGFIYAEEFLFELKNRNK